MTKMKWEKLPKKERLSDYDGQGIVCSGSVYTKEDLQKKLFYFKRNVAGWIIEYQRRIRKTQAGVYTCANPEQRIKWYNKQIQELKNEYNKFVRDIHQADGDIKRQYELLESSVRSLQDRTIFRKKTSPYSKFELLFR